MDKAKLKMWEIVGEGKPYIFIYRSKSGTPAICTNAPKESFKFMAMLLREAANNLDNNNVEMVENNDKTH